MPRERLASPYRRPDVRHVVQLAALDLRPDANDGAMRIERVREQLQHRRAALEHIEQALAGLQLGAPCIAEQAGGAAEEQPRAVVADRVDECRPQPVEEVALSRRQRGILEPSAQRARPQTEADQLILEIGASPVRRGPDQPDLRARARAS